MFTLIAIVVCIIVFPPLGWFLHGFMKGLGKATRYLFLSWVNKR